MCFANFISGCTWQYESETEERRQLKSENEVYLCNMFVGTEIL